jgi:hypothetical protein
MAARMRLRQTMKVVAFMTPADLPPIRSDRVLATLAEV